MLVRYKNGKIDKYMPCVAPFERNPTLLEQLEAFSFDPPSEDELKLWIDPILPYFKATRSKRGPGREIWIYPSNKKFNLLHALVVLTRSYSTAELYNGPFPVPEPGVDPLKYLFNLYKEDRLTVQKTGTYQKVLFANSNHGFQFTEKIMAEIGVPIDKLSLSKLVSDLSLCEEKVDASWRKGNRVGIVSE